MSTKQIQKPSSDIYHFDKQIQNLFIKIRRDLPSSTVQLVEKYDRVMINSSMAPQVQQLKELRDNKLLQTESGTSFINILNDFYYSFSPVIADYERENPLFKETVKLAITPMISSLSILNYVDMETDAEVLGYGISLILLNIGTYVRLPVTAIVVIRKKF